MVNNETHPDPVDEATTNYISKLRRLVSDRRVGRGQDWLMCILWCIVFAQIGVTVLLYKTNMVQHMEHDVIDAKIVEIQTIVNDHIMQDQAIKKDPANSAQSSLLNKSAN